MLAHDGGDRCNVYAHLEALSHRSREAAFGGDDVQLERARVIEQQRFRHGTPQQCARLPVSATGRARLDPAHLPCGSLRQERAETRMVALTAEGTEQDMRVPRRAAAAAAKLARPVETERLDHERQRTTDVTITLA